MGTGPGREGKAMKLLATDNITIKFGGITAVNNFNLTLQDGEIIGLIGPNGAGKTTVFNMITGVYTPTSGTVKFCDVDITGKKPNYITKLGAARTFQNIRLFSSMNVLQNILLAKHSLLKASPVSAVLSMPGYNKEMKRHEEECWELLEKVGLANSSKEIATSLPYGKQRRLEIARALATEPKLLLLDEPAAGMNPKESEDLMNFIHQVRDEFKVSVLMIEHHMKVVMGVCERIFVLDHGETIAQGTPVEIQGNQKVIEAYLGVKKNAKG
jgi:branched-chain amino acid transport system ATP-binding protein